MKIPFTKPILIHSTTPQSLKKNNAVKLKSIKNNAATLSIKHISSLLVVFTDLYDQRVIYQYGQKDVSVWFDALKDLTPDTLKNGIKTLRDGTYQDQFSLFPPTPLQFRMLCLAYADGVRLNSVVAILIKLKKYDDRVKKSSFVLRLVSCS